jgi:hypothetical protein
MRRIPAGHVLCVLLAVLLSYPSNPVFAQKAKSEGILFLRLTLKNDSIALRQTVVRPGTLKSNRASFEREGLAYDVVSPGGEVLWHGVIDDPLVRRYEYEDPAEPGKIKTTVISQRDAEFTIRIPVVEAMHSVRFSKVTRGVGATGGKFVRAPMGTIAIPPREGWR